MRKKNGILYLASAFLTIFFLTYVATDYAESQIVHKKGSEYPDIASKSTISFTSKFNGTVIVIDDGVYRTLKFASESNSATQSKVYLKDKNKLLFNYTICSTLGFVLFREPTKEINNVLMIGLGGGSLPRFIKKYFPQANIDNVEIDPLIADIAKKYFFVEEKNGFNVYVEDGRKYIERINKRYDVIILDAFGSDNEIPLQLTSQEFLIHVKSRLSLQGIVITNFINHDQRKYESIAATYRSVFKHVMRFNLDEFNKTNIIIISFDDESKNFELKEFIRRADEFSKFFNNEYDLRKYAVLRDNDSLKEKGVEIIHDK
jgi:spermidine synthase